MFVRPKRVHPHAGRSTHQLGTADQLPELPGGQGGVQLQDLCRSHPAHHLDDGEAGQLSSIQTMIRRSDARRLMWYRYSLIGPFKI